MKLDLLNINKDYPTDQSNFTAMNWREIKYIVLHYTGGTASAKNNAQYYSNTSGVGASAHFFVGHASENAQIYQGVDPKDMAWHCGTDGTYYSECRNSNSIGIEICVHNDTDDKTAESGAWYFDDLTIERVLQLVRALMDDYNIPIDNVIRHYDVTHKICPAVWVNDPAQWDNFKKMLSTYQFPAQPTEPVPTESGTIYRVQVGAFSVRANAEAMRDKLVVQGYTDAFIT